MNSRMKLLVLLVITMWTQQSDADNATCIFEVDAMNTIGTDFTLQCHQLSNVSCRWSENMRGSGSSEYMEMLNINCSSNQDCNSIPNCTNVQEPTHINQTVTVQYTRIITIQQTQTEYTRTTIVKCPTSSYELPSTALSSVYSTRCPVSTPSTVTVTNCPQPAVAFTGVLEISILATSGVLICLPMLALLVVMYCWVKTRKTLKKREAEGVKLVYVAKDSFPNQLNEDTNKDNPDTETVKKVDNPSFELKTVTPPATAKPKTKPKPPQRPSIGPEYATPQTAVRNDRKEPKNIKYSHPDNGASVGVVSKTKHQLEERNLHHKGKKSERKESTGKKQPCEHEYDKPVIAPKPKRLQNMKEKGEEHKYYVFDGPVPRSGRDNKNDITADSEGKEENKYAILETRERKQKKGKAKIKQEERMYHVLEVRDNKKGTSADPKIKQEEHKYHVLEATGGKHNGKDTGIHSESREEHKYHTLERLTPSDETGEKKSCKTERDNTYHVLEGPIPKVKKHKLGGNPDKKERENAYHVLEAPLSRDENKKQQNRKECENDYYVLEGPTPIGKEK